MHFAIKMMKWWKPYWLKNAKRLKSFKVWNPLQSHEQGEGLDDEPAPAATEGHDDQGDDGDNGDGDDDDSPTDSGNGGGRCGAEVFRGKM